MVVLEADIANSPDLGESLMDDPLTEAVPIVVGLLVVNAAAPARQEPAERPTLVP